MKTILRCHRAYLLLVVLLFGLLSRPSMAGPMEWFVDLVQPIVRTEPLTNKLRLWLLVLPGLSNGGTTWRSLTGQFSAPMTGMASPGTATSGWGHGPGRQGGWGTVHFDGTNDLLLWPANQLAYTGAWAACFWIWPPNGFANFQKVIFQGTTGGSREAYAWDVTAATTAQFSWNNTAIVTSTAMPATGTWTHVCLVRTGATGAWTAGIYYNGRLHISATTTTNPTNTAGNQVAMIARVDASQALAAHLDDVMMWDRGLSAGEVLAVYKDSLLGHPRMLGRPIEVIATMSAAPSRKRLMPY